jgi:hypothetical protein
MALALAAPLALFSGILLILGPRDRAEVGAAVKVYAFFLFSYFLALLMIIMLHSM